MSFVCKSSYFSADWVWGGLQNKVATFSLIWQFCVWIAWKLYFPEKHEATFRLQFLLLPFYSLTSFSGFFKTSVPRFPNPRLLFFTLIFIFSLSFPPFANLVSSSLYMHLSRHVTSSKESNMFIIFTLLYLFHLHHLYHLIYFSPISRVHQLSKSLHTNIFFLSFSITTDKA